MFITIKCNHIFSVDFCFVLVNIMFEQRFFFAILCNIFFLRWLHSSAWVSALCFPLSLQCLFALIWCDVHSAVFFSSNIDNYDICIIFFAFIRCFLYAISMFWHMYASHIIYMNAKEKNRIPSSFSSEFCLYFFRFKVTWRKQATMKSQRGHISGWNLYFSWFCLSSGFNVTDLLKQSSA